LRLEQVPERSHGSDGFGSRIDRPKADGRVLRPTGRGNKPHRMVEKLRRRVEGSWRIDCTGCDGAMLQRGASSYSP
jgi:hypothetical protein